MSGSQYKVCIKDLPENERPRERLLSVGVENLSNRDLIAIILRTGTASESALGLADRLLAQFTSLRELVNCSIDELSAVRGIGTAKACQLKAALELGRRSSREASGFKREVSSPADVADLVMEEMRFLDREHFKIVMLDTKNRVIGTRVISIGNLNSSLVHPRELFKETIKRSCASIVLVHNHPSGDPSPSAEDIAITQRLRDAGKLLGIEVLDHVIIGDNRYVSLKERRLV